MPYQDHKETSSLPSYLMFCLYFVILVAWCCSANAEESWYNITGISKHTNTTTKHNERNWGLGYETVGPWNVNWQFGYYHNSFWKPTTYITAELTSYHITDTLRFRINGGLVTGYRYAVTPYILPVFTYENTHWGLDMLTVPSVGGRQGIYAIQLKLRF